MEAKADNKLYGPSDITDRPRAPWDGRSVLKGLRVLVVEDEADMRELLIIALTLYGAKVVASASTAEALEALKYLRPDVLVSDLGMAGEDGYVLIRKVRAREPGRWARIPAIALTAYASVEHRMRALAAGFDVYVLKPIEPDKLAMIIADLVGWTNRTE